MRNKVRTSVSNTISILVHSFIVANLAHCCKMLMTGKTKCGYVGTLYYRGNNFVNLKLFSFFKSSIFKKLHKNKNTLHTKRQILK